MRTAFVTGASGGVGGRLAARLAEQGWRVFGAARGNGLLPEKVERVVLDFTDDRSVEAAIEKVAGATRESGLDALVNCAGIIVEGPLELVPVSEFRRQFDVNVAGPFALIRALAPQLRRARGRIVNIGAVSAHVTPPFYGPIAASKAAIASLSDAARLELGAFGVKVTLIEPGALRTSIFDTARQAQSVAMSEQSPKTLALYQPAIKAFHEAMGKFAADDPEVVVRAALRALDDRNPRARLLVGKGAAMMARLRMLPDAWRDRLLLNTVGVSRALKRAAASL
jgi:NAD(P)-dependent dehydrogenase (short-subunit alcohol dehydrogenase family)